MLFRIHPPLQPFMEVRQLRFAEPVSAQIECDECPVLAGGRRLVEEPLDVACDVGGKSATRKNKDSKFEGRESPEEDLRIPLPDRNMFQMKCLQMVRPPTPGNEVWEAVSRDTDEIQ
jgi:hypothetical protein